MADTIIPFLQVGQLEPHSVQYLVQDHTSKQWQSWDSKSSVSNVKAHSLNHWPMAMQPPREDERA